MNAHQRRTTRRRQHHALMAMITPDTLRAANRAIQAFTAAIRTLIDDLPAMIAAYAERTARAWATQDLTTSDTCPNNWLPDLCWRDTCTAKAQTPVGLCQEHADGLRATITGR